MKKRILSLILCIAMCMSVVGIFASCGGDSTTGSSSTTGSNQGDTNNSGTNESTNQGGTTDSSNNNQGTTNSSNNNQGGNNTDTTPEGTGIPANKDALVIMSEELDGLFNPFYSTTGADSTIVSMTQIGMLTSKYVNGDVQVAFGDNEAVVTKDYTSSYNEDKDTTTYTFVIKNGIKYSDGHPLTIEDVLFNLYVYLDPVYAGSATLYSTKIQGLTAYRTQREDSDTGTDTDSQLSEQASSRATARVNELVNLFKTVGRTQTAGKYYATMDAMKSAINALTIDEISSGYMTAVSAKPGSVSLADWKAQLLADYEKICTLYREELEKAYDTAIEAYTETPYKDHAEFKDQLFCFMASQGYVEIKYVKVNGKDDRNNIESVTAMFGDQIDTRAEAIDYAFNDSIESQLHLVYAYTASAQTIFNEYVSNAKDVILHEMVKDDGSVAIDNISGIVSLGHKGDVDKITVNGTEYKIAKEHNADGTPKNAGEYDVLQITIDGVDPKAVWNFAFAVAPQHYYGEGSKVGVDIANNKFGVEWGSFDFMTKIIQSQRNITIPMGAGAYKATNSANDDNPSGSSFYSANIVYFKANNNFYTVGSGINNAKIEKVRYQVVGASNALAMLENGSIHYATPQLTEYNFTKIEQLDKIGANYILTEQLGYGYIGINASKVENVYLRRAIMCAMNTELALAYYRPGTAQRIFWPMSTVSWAYPKTTSGDLSTENGRDYPAETFYDDGAKELISYYMEMAAVEDGGYTNDDLKITFTIAGSNLQEHPTYATFRDAAALLNSMGWNVTVQADTQALTKLSTGSLEVWAAAWGSTIDPDLYQVYHKNSTATSTLAWGYPAIKSSGSDEEKNLLNTLSDYIEKARETDLRAKRTALYEKAMGCILDLAIELPVYQRSVVYVYNANVIDKNSLPSEVNPYSSPLDRIWELEFVK